MAKLQYNIPEYNRPASRMPKSTNPINTLPTLTLPTVEQPKRHQPPSVLPDLPRLPQGFSYNQYTNKSDPKNSLFVADYNDPTQINSLADVIFSKNWFDAFGQYIGNVWNPLLHTNEKGEWDPQWFVFALNSLSDAGETLDILANPVKGLFLEGTEGFKKAVNWDGTGRTNYVYNTGNWFVDMALEIISDPLNLVTWGVGSGAKAAAKMGFKAGSASVKTVVKNAVKKSFKATARELTEEAAEEITENAVRRAIKRTAREFIQDSKGVIKKAIKHAPDAATQNKAAAGIYARMFRENLTTELVHKHGLKQRGVDMLQHLLKTSGGELVDSTLDAVSLKVLKGLRQAYGFTHTLDKGLLKAGLSQAGVYPTYLLLKKVPARWSTVAKKIIDKRLVAVMHSPIIYKAKDALSTLRVIKNELDIDISFQDLLKEFEHGEITVKDLGDILCAKLSAYTDKITKIIKENNQDELAKLLKVDPSEVAEVSNKYDIANLMLKKEIGYDSIDDCIDSLLSLKGSVSTDSERHIYKLIELRKELIHMDYHNNLAKELSELKLQKNTLTSFDAKPLGKSLRDKSRVNQALTHVKNELHAITSNNVQGINARALTTCSVVSKALKRCTTVADVDAILTSFQSYVKMLQRLSSTKGKFRALLDANTKIELLGTIDEIQATVRAALQDSRTYRSRVGGLDGVEIRAMREAFVDFTEAKVKDVITTRAYYAFISATNDGLHGAARLTSVKDSVSDYIRQMRLFEKKAANIPQLEELAAKYSADLQKQLDDVFSVMSKETRSPKSVVAHLNKGLKINTAEFNEATAYALERINKRIRSLEKMTQPQEKISSTISKQLANSTALGTKKLKFIESLKTDDIRTLESNIIGAEHLANREYVEQNTSVILKWLDEKFEASTISSTLTKGQQTLTDNAIEAFRLDVAAASETLRKLAAGESVQFDDLVAARQTLVKAYETQLTSADALATNKIFGGALPVFGAQAGRAEVEAQFKTIRSLLDLSDEDKYIIDYVEDYYIRLSSNISKRLPEFEATFATKELPILKQAGYNSAQITAAQTDYINQAVKALELSTRESELGEDVYKAWAKIFERFETKRLKADTEYMSEQFKALAEYINAIDPEQIRVQQVLVAADAVYYALKGEQLVNVLAYIGDTALVKKITEMCDSSSEFFSVLKTVANNTSEEFADFAKRANELIYFAENFLQYVKTHNEIMRLAGTEGFSDELVLAFRSTLEKFARTPLIKAETDLDSLVTKIVSDVENYYNYSIVWEESFAQDKILARSAEWYDKEFGIKGYFHRADTDAKATFAIRQKELGGVPEEYRGRRVVAFDIETTDLSDTTRIVEIGTFDGSNQRLYKRMYKDRVEARNNMPGPSALNKSYSDVNKWPDYDAKVDAFCTEHIAENPQSAKECYESFLSDIFAEGDDVVLIGHNCNSFDIPNMVLNFEEAGVDPNLINKFKNATVLDNLEDLRKQAGYISLTAEQAQTIKTILQDHIDTKLYTGELTYFFDAGVKGMRESLSEFIENAEKTYPGLSKGFTNRAIYGIDENVGSAALTEAAKDAPASIDALNRFCKDLREAFTTAGANTVYTHELPIVSKGALAELTPESVHPDFAEFVAALGKDIQLSKVLNDPKAASVLDPDIQNPFISFWGYKKVVDVNKVLDWFAVATEDGYTDINRMKLYTLIAQQLDALAPKLRNVPQLQDPRFVDQLHAFLNEIKALTQDPRSPVSTGKASIWADSLRIDRADTTGALAVGIRLYGRVKGTLTAELKSKYSEVIQVLSNNSAATVKPYAIPAAVIGYSDSIKTLKDAFDLQEALFDMELKQSADAVFTARAQFNNHALLKTHDYIVREQNHISQFSKDYVIMYKAQNRKAMNNLCITQTKQILSRSPEELQKYMVYHRAPIMFFNKDDASLVALAKQLTQSGDAYKAFNIEFFETNEMFAIRLDADVDYFVDSLGFHATLNGKQIDIVYDSELGLDFGDFRHPEDLAVIFKEIGEITNGQSIGQLGIQLSGDTIEQYYAKLPKALQEKLNLAQLTKSTMFEGFRFDTMNIGSLASRRYYNPYMPTDMTRLIATNNPKIIAKANQKNLALDFYFNSELRISALKAQYGEAAEQVILNKVKDGDKVIAIMQDKKLIGKGFHGQGYKVVEFNPENKKMWALAMDVENDLGAILVPGHMYAEIYNLLNTSLVQDSPLYKVAHQIIYLTKLGLISTVGKVFRDVVESQLKAMIETRDALGVIKNNFKAYKNLKQYKKAVCDILALSEIDYDKLVAKGINPTEFASNYINNRFAAEASVQEYYRSLKDVLKMDRAKMFLPENKKLYFEQISKNGMDEATFDTLHAILTESGTLGQLPAWGKYTLDLHKAKQAKFAQEYADGLIGEQMLEKSGSAWQKTYDGLSNFGNFLLSPAQYMDQVNRVSLYFTLMDSGFVNSASALGRVSRTMFDATIKTDSELLMELAIPFYAFFKHNMLYWAEAVAENPWLARLFSDYLESSQNETQFGTVSDFEKANNLSLQSAKLAGNIAITGPNERVEREIRYSKKGNPYYVDVVKHDDQVTLKLNFPFMEAYQMASNPIGYLAGATNPVIQLALQSWIGNNPNVPKGVATALDVYRPYNFDEGGRTNLQWYSIVPFVGPVLQKWGPDGYAKKQYEQTGFLGNLILPSVFGKLNRYDGESQFAGMVNQYPNYNNYYKYKKQSGPRINTYRNQHTGLAKVRTAYTKTKKAKIKTYNPNYYNKYNYNTRAYSNPYNHNKAHTYYTNRVKFYPYRLPRKPRPSVYKLLYNSYGKSRLQYLGFPRTVKNTSNALRKYFSYTR